MTVTFQEWLVRTGRNVTIDGVECVVVEEGWSEESITCSAPPGIAKVTDQAIAGSCCPNVVLSLC
jgi:hypothetical protein